jgi:hypothetical protein
MTRRIAGTTNTKAEIPFPKTIDSRPNGISPKRKWME